MQLNSVRPDISDDDVLYTIHVQRLLQATDGEDQNRHQSGLLKSSTSKTAPTDDKPDLPGPLEPGHQHFAQLGGEEETHRGINIQRPWAELILRGIKGIEARVYLLRIVPRRSTMDYPDARKR